MFDDAQHLTGRVAHDTSVTGRIVQIYCQYGQVLSVRGGNERHQGVFPHQRYIAVQHEHCTVIGHVRQRLHDGMTGAALLRLQHPVYRRVTHGLFDGIAAETVYDVYLLRLQPRAALDDVRQQGPARQRLQHLWQIGFHAGALTGGENDDA